MEKTKRSKKENVLLLTQMAVLTAITFIMAFTPLGYIRTAGVEITFMTIPVIVAAIVLGPAAGAIIGGVFGITSVIQALGLSPFGVTLMSINPFFTVFVCMIPRILMGYLTGIIFKALHKIDKTKVLSYAGSSICGALLNTILFMTSLILLFGRTEYIKDMMGDNSVLKFVVLFVGINGLIEAAVCFVVGAAISKVLVHYVKPRLGKA